MTGWNEHLYFNPMHYDCRVFVRIMFNYIWHFKGPFIGKIDVRTMQCSAALKSSRVGKNQCTRTKMCHYSNFKVFSCKHQFEHGMSKLWLPFYAELHWQNTVLSELAQCRIFGIVNQTDLGHNTIHFCESQNIWKWNIARNVKHTKVFFKSDHPSLSHKFSFKCKRFSWQRK